MVMKIASKFLSFIASFILGERWNATIAHSGKECGNLFKGAKDSIRIVTGELQHELFEDNEVLSILEDLSTRKENPVTIEIIHGPNPDPRSKRIFKLQQKAKGRVHIMRLPKRPLAHFILVDEKKFRVEKYHEANKPERMAYMKTRGSLFLNRILAEKFEDLKVSNQKPGT